jgi:rare lipoprotein A
MKLLPTITASLAVLTLGVLNSPVTSANAEPKTARASSGPASWYGPGFHGRKTASGERFDQNALTAAHRTLPFGTKVRVTCNRSGKSVTVRINDCGPFHGNRMIDLSRGVASKIGIVGSGVGKVKIEVLA